MQFWQDIVSRVSFRDVELSVSWLHDYDEPQLRLVAEVEDTYHPGQKTQVLFGQMLPRMITDPTGAIEAVRWAVRRWWLHEFDELFRVDGVIYDDPHAKDIR